LLPQDAYGARRSATPGDDHLRGTVVVLENASQSLPGHDGNGVIYGCRQRCDEFVVETLVVPLCVIVHYVSLKSPRTSSVNMDMKISPDCTALGRATVARTEAKLLILCGISGGRVLAQDGEARVA
jgi:hypothetical protein